MSPHPQVLIAVSDPESGRALQTILSDFGLKPVVAPSLSEAQAILSKQSVPLVFCESQLPGGGFRELLQLTAPARIPLVVAARLPETRQYLEAMSLGAFDFLAAPIRRADVEQILTNVLRRLPVSTQPQKLRKAAAAAR
jgi:DNA-binding NtrC family response regulator